MKNQAANAVVLLWSSMQDFSPPVVYSCGVKCICEPIKIIQIRKTQQKEIWYEILCIHSKNLFITLLIFSCGYIFPHYFYFLTGILLSSPGTAQQYSENYNVATPQEKCMHEHTYAQPHTARFLTAPLPPHFFSTRAFNLKGDVCDD